MKSKIAFAAACMLLFSVSGFASAVPHACVKGTLASYIKLGGQGCIFNHALYRNFSFVVPVQGGAAPADIDVTPTPVSTPELFTGINFTGSWSVGSGESLLFTIGYDVAPYPAVAATAPPITGTLTLDLGESQVLENVGSVTVQENTNAITPNLDVFDICSDTCHGQKTAEVGISTPQELHAHIVVTLVGGGGGASLKGFASDYAIGR